MAVMCIVLSAAGTAFGAGAGNGKTPEAVQKAIEAAGFVAFAPGKMNWSEAQAYCASKGGKLPLVGGSKSSGAMQMGMPVDGFGSWGAPWPSGLPEGYYWTGTENSRGPEQALVVDVKRGNVNLGVGKQKSSQSVVCVP
jgi:hypothetical protein